MDWLIESKLAPPAAFAAAVPRGYAMARLREALAGHATLLVAPAGYGKTELLARWHQQCRDDGLRVGWLSLEPEDAQIEVFLDYALAALGQPPASSAAASPSTRRAAASRLLAATLADERRSLLFLDDYERLGGALDELLRLLIERASPRLHLVIAARLQPDIGLAELRARRLVTELGPAELRLSFQEAHSLLAAGPRAVTEGDVALLLQRTEGWPIALRMAGDFVQSHPDAAAPLTGFSGRVDELATYLYDAILRTLPADEQQALLALACVPRVCGELLNALAGRRDGGALLQRFARRNVLLSRLEGEADWYRLHPLLAEFLRARLAHTDAGAPQDLHRRAARWFAGAGLLPEALRAASAAQDAALVAGLLDRAGGWRLVVDGRIGLLRAHLDAIDDATLLRHPRLALARPLLLAKSAARLQAGAWLERVRQASAGFARALDSAAPGFDDAQLTLEARAIPVVVGWYLDEAPPGGYAADIEALRAAVDPATDPLLAATVGNLWCYELQGLRRHRAAWDAAAQALATIHGGGFADEELYLGFIQAGILIEQARLPEALALLRALQAQAERDGGPGSDLAAICEVLLARVLTLQGDAAGAQELLERSLPQVQEQDTWFEIAWAGFAAARGVAVLAGDEAAARAAIERGLALAERRRLRRLGARLQLLRIDGLLAAGEAAHALDLAEALDLAGLQARFEAVDRRLSDAAWLTAQRLQPGDGSVLAAAIERWADEGSTLQQVEALLLQAALALGRRQAQTAARALDRALSLAVPGQLLLPFVEQGAGLSDAFEQALTRSGGRGAPNQRARFLATVQDNLRRRRGSVAAGRKPQALSPREAEIARLLAEGLSNKLIGRELALSEGTVKFHLRNLYAKLGAHNRDQAVQLLRA
ncbi:MAG: LuxR C-terminal-related transcriptional regulator [Proteobacteria bacterium]|nr:LuxR C-terminal-related transcriptional regulator [Pseudomonadota bacterium]